MTDGDSEEKKTNRESSNRWQGRTIQQFGYASNLILGLSVAAVGFELSLVLNRVFEISGWQSCFFAMSLVALVLSIGFGLFGVINRLRDFRATTKTARKYEDGATDLELQPLRILTDSLGRTTWLLFWWQIATFGFGIFLFVLAVGTAVARVLN